MSLSYSHLEDVHTGQKFEVTHGGTYNKVSIITKLKFAYFHLHNRKVITSDIELQPSPQEQLLTRLHELRNKNKVFKWFYWDNEFKGFIRITSWRKNKYDFVVEGYLVDDNLELVQLIGDKK